MKTAEQIIISHMLYKNYNIKSDIAIRIERAINEARRECIDECAEAVDLFDVMNIKQSILKLKEQIK